LRGATLAADSQRRETLSIPFRSRRPAVSTESAAVQSPDTPSGLKKGAIGMVAVIFMAVATPRPSLP
jgi:hypothetical protein